MQCVVNLQECRPCFSKSLYMLERERSYAVCGGDGGLLCPWECRDGKILGACLVYHCLPGSVSQSVSLSVCLPACLPACLSLFPPPLPVSFFFCVCMPVGTQEKQSASDPLELKLKAVMSSDVGAGN